MEKPNDILLPEVRNFVSEGHTVTLRVRGWSMRPFLENLRDKVVLDACDRVRVNDVVLAEIAPGHFVLHRVVGVDEQLGRLVLRGDGNYRGVERCRIEDVAAKAVGFYRGRTFYSVDGKTWRAYSCLWTRTRRLPRRYLLAIYRRLPFLHK